MSDRSRRLAAIFMADIVGFSRMMRRDDRATTERVVHFHEEVQTLVDSHGGRVVDTAGDSVFAVFDSIVVALECASALQGWLAKDDGPDRIMVRIGLHFGDVLIHGDDLYGDGVNIAARLEQMAPPGGIAVSDVVFQEVSGRVPFRDAGPQSLKNIDRPVRVHVVPPEHFGFPPQTDPQSERHGDAAESEAIRELGALIREKVAARRAALPSQVGEAVESVAGRAEAEADDAPSTVSSVVTSPRFWASLAAGALLVAAHPGGWTTNGVYPVVGSIIVASSLGRLMGAAVGRRGMRSLLISVALAVSGLVFLDGAVSRAVVWVVAAGVLGSAVAGMRRTR